MNTQQLDPVSQAMQILQLVTQRRGQQANIDQGNRELGIREQQINQQGRQFDQELAWDQEQAQMRNNQAMQELMLRQLAQQQGQEQFNAKLGFDQQMAQQGQQQWEQEQQRRMLEIALEQSRFAQQAAVDDLYKQAITRKMNMETSGQWVDPQRQAVEHSRVMDLVNLLQAQIQSTQNPIEAARLQAQQQQVLERAYQGLLPPLRPYTPDELRQMQSVNMIPGR